jgi:putative redox protein
MDGKYLEASAQLINQKIKFACQVEGKEPVIVDYFPPHGDGEGYTSLQLLLLSLASCFGSTVKLMINGHLKTQVKALCVHASGTRREEHPTCFESIHLTLELSAPGLEKEALEKTIQVAKDTICPVWALLKNNVDISTEYTLVSA